MEITWLDLEDQICNSLNQSSSNQDYVARAFEILLGQDFLESAVQQCIYGMPQAGLARQILVRIRSSIAMEYCYQIYQKSNNFDEKIEALGLIRWIANKDVIQWIPEFLNHVEEDIRSCGIAIVDQMLFKHVIYYEDIEEILKGTLNHTQDQYVRERIQGFIDAEELGRVC
jgi:hypothetical protein